jgi:hypothetical protein
MSAGGGLAWTTFSSSLLSRSNPNFSSDSRVSWSIWEVAGTTVTPAVFSRTRVSVTLVILSMLTWFALMPR